MAKISDYLMVGEAAEYASPFLDEIADGIVANRRTKQNCPPEASRFRRAGLRAKSRFKGTLFRGVE